jgi:hypothetical protein
MSEQDKGCEEGRQSDQNRIIRLKYSSFILKLSLYLKDRLTLDIST